MTLELIPNGDLIFKGPFTAVSTTTLKLSNSGNERLAYKIKTTAPKRYCVKPNSGFLDANATANIQGRKKRDDLWFSNGLYFSRCFSYVTTTTTRSI